MRPLSLGSPFHFGRIIAFSDCSRTCSGTVSTTTIFAGSRLRYDRSYGGRSIDIEVPESRRRYLDDAAIERACTFPGQTMRHEELVLVKLFEDGCGGLQDRTLSARIASSGVRNTHVYGLSGEDYDLVELGQVGEEVVQARALSCSPAVLAL